MSPGYGCRDYLHWPTGFEMPTSYELSYNSARLLAFAFARSILRIAVVRIVPKCELIAAHHMFSSSRTGTELRLITHLQALDFDAMALSSWHMLDVLPKQEPCIRHCRPCERPLC